MSCEVAGSRSLDLDDASLEIREMSRGERTRDGLLDGNDGDVRERLHQYERGSPRTRSATYVRIKFVEIGATWYKRVSRSLRSMSYSAANPNPPSVWSAAFPASHEASAARKLREVRIGAASFTAIESNRGAKSHQVRSFGMGVGARERKLNPLVLADRAPKHFTVFRVVARALEKKGVRLRRIRRQ